MFKLDTAGQETVLYSFNGGSDGALPQAGVIRDSHGNFYGTTARGGNPSCPFGGGAGCGTIFQVDPTGKETVLYRFTGHQDGAAPAAALYRDASGNLWGTTQFGGFNGSNCFVGCGTIFRLDPKGKLTTHMLKGAPTEGSWPLAGVIADSAGNLYGTTLFGGANDAGTIFKISTSGKVSILYSFDISDGAGPTELLLSGGQFYGPTTGGGAEGTGAVFRFGASGEKLLYSFGITNGFFFSPQGTMVRDSSGNLYGTAAISFDQGLLYKVEPNGKYTVLVNFGGPNGEMPMAGVIGDEAGNLYGTTELGGNPGAGTVFKYTP